LGRTSRWTSFVQTGEPLAVSGERVLGAVILDSVLRLG